jgi:DNA-binding NtrC family response regulator
MEQHLRIVQDGGFSPEFSTTSRSLISQLQQLWKLARLEMALCFSGETGTGKTLLAQDVHQASPRAGNPFVVVDCTSLPAGVIESELFGHVKGSYTSATSTRIGLIESADGGTIFLDEISELPVEMQSKLLRVVQHGLLRPVGSSEEKTVDVRWPCATHADLSSLIQQGRFREDLYFRLCKWTLTLPPLRARPEDIEMYSDRYFADQGTSLHARCTQAAINALKEYEWPGNVRQLESVLEVSHALTEAETIDVSDLQFGAPIATPSRGTSTASHFGENVGICVGDSLDSANRALAQATLLTQNGNLSAVALQLGVSRYKLRKDIKRWGL